MSRTQRTHKGETYRQCKERKRYDKKEFGHTDGQHSRGLYDHHWEGGKLIHIKTDRAPIKGVDFVKYGYPFDLRHKDVIIHKLQREESAAEIKEYEDQRGCIPDKELFG